MPLAKQWKVCLAGDIVRPVAENLHDDVGCAENIGPTRKNLGALLLVVGIGIPGADPGPRFHHNFKTRFRQGRNDNRNQGNSPLPGIALLGDANDQAVIVLSNSAEQTTVIDSVGRHK